MQRVIEDNAKKVLPSFSNKPLAKNEKYDLLAGDYSYTLHYHIKEIEDN